MAALCLFLSAGFAGSLKAQSGTITVSGQVMDATDMPLIGVNVMEEGTTNGTITDFDGNYSLTVSAGAKVSFSYIGYKTVVMDAAPTINVVLEEEATMLNEVVAATMVGGATLTKLLGTSAWYAPGAAGAYVVESILHNQKKMIPCSVYLEGEYGESDICIGVPVILGKNGIEKIVELELTADEKAKFAASAAAVHKTNAALKEVGAL